VKNGLTHNKNQNNKCKNCNRQFVFNPRKKVIGEETKNLIDKLLLPKLPLAGIARITGVSERWLQIYVNKLYQSIAKEVENGPKKRSINGNVLDILMRDYTGKPNS